MSAARRLRGSARPLVSLLVVWVAQPHVLGGVTQCRMPPKGEARDQSVLCRAAICRGARRANRLGSRAGDPADRRGDRAVRLALEPERERRERARALGRIGRPSGRRRRARRRRGRIRALVGHHPQSSSVPWRRPPDRVLRGARVPVPNCARNVAREQNADADSLVCDSELAIASSQTTRKRSMGSPRRLRASRPCVYAVGRGSVTVINATPFRDRDLFEGLTTAAVRGRDGAAAPGRGAFPDEDDASVAARAHLAVRRPGGRARADRAGAADCGATASRFGPLATSRRGAPLARRADPRHRPVRAAPRRRRVAARRGRCARSTEAATRRVPATPACRQPERAAALAASDRLRRDALHAAVHHAGLAATAASCATRSRSSRPPGARPDRAAFVHDC